MTFYLLTGAVIFCNSLCLAEYNKRSQHW